MSNYWQIRSPFRIVIALLAERHPLPLFFLLAPIPQIGQRYARRGGGGERREKRAEKVRPIPPSSFVQSDLASEWTKGGKGRSTLSKKKPPIQSSRVEKKGVFQTKIYRTFNREKFIKFIIQCIRTVVNLEDKLFRYIGELLTFKRGL